ncbi:hypothetical protein [Actinomadura meridiana]|uniref:hypothetical protein n=1 Tax=Actinomadura meridiana TaxID=559626 RepID=UPI0031F109B6
MGAKRLTARSAQVSARIFPNVTAAEEDYDHSWRSAKTTAGTASSSLGDIHAEAPSIVGGVGDEAFAQPQQVADKFGRSANVTTTVRLSNAVLVVTYEGATYGTDENGAIDLSRATPLDESVSRAAAQTIAQNVVTAFVLHG